jgi:hypothetical protein
VQSWKYVALASEELNMTAYLTVEAGFYGNGFRFADMPTQINYAFYAPSRTYFSDGFSVGYQFNRGEPAESNLEDAFAIVYYDDFVRETDPSGTTIIQGSIREMQIEGTGLVSANLTFEGDPLPLAASDRAAFLLEQDWVMRLSNGAETAPETLNFGYGGPAFNLSGNDQVWCLNGDDVFFSGDGDDTVYGGYGDDILSGGIGNDRLLGANDEDRVFGGDGDDSVFGNNGNDYVFGGSGNDLVSGNAGNDRVIGDEGDDRVFGSSGADRLYGSDALFGGSGADALIGAGGSDTMNGGLGNDRLYGGDGADRLYGNVGNDLLVGGNGADVFIFRDGHGHDDIRDFDVDEDGEQIDLQGVTAITDFGDLRDNHMVQVGADVVIDDGAGLTITLQNVDLGDLGARDFIF